ncbi:MAG: acetyltransferase [Minwuia thermotolerans]|nr:MAG: acetyltransferase [Minwuia thermotolerans]
MEHEVNDARIRDYEDGDLGAVLDVWSRASALGHPFLSAAFLAEERRRIPEVYLPAAHTRVWVEDGRVVGFIALLGNEIGALFVDPGHGRRGIASSLVTWARSAHGRLEVEVFEENAVGRAFYESRGFASVLTRDHEETGRRLIRMTLTSG